MDKRNKNTVTKKLSVSDALDKFNIALHELDDVRVLDPRKTRESVYGFFDYDDIPEPAEPYYPLATHKQTLFSPEPKQTIFVARGVLAFSTAGAIGLGALTVFTGLGFIGGFAVACLITGVTGHTLMTSPFYDGISDNWFQRIVTKLFFSEDNKARLAKHRQKFEDYKKLEDSYNLLVDFTRKELEEEGVFKVLHEHGLYYGIDSDGYPALVDSPSSIVALSNVESLEKKRAFALEKKLATINDKLKEKMQKLT